MSETRENKLISTLYKIVDSDKDGSIEAMELEELLNTFSHVPIDESNLDQ
jgi:Ca2+-binding EF-hand superfamily protein